MAGSPPSVATAKAAPMPTWNPARMPRMKILMAGCKAEEIHTFVKLTTTKSTIDAGRGSATVYRVAHVCVCVRRPWFASRQPAGNI